MDNLESRPCREKRCTRIKACPAFNTKKPTCTHPSHHDGFVHIRATCKDLLVQETVGNHGTCGRAGCTYGHDFPDVRISIFKARRWEAECHLVLDEQLHQDALAAGKRQAIEKEEKRAAKASRLLA